MCSNGHEWCFAWMEASPGASSLESKAALLKKTMWTPGEVIAIAFIDGQAAVQSKVLAVAKEWTAEMGGPANLQFTRSNDAKAADIRVSFAQRGSWSTLGTTCRRVPKDRPTMNFGWLTPETSENDLRRVVLHEFGHALGMVHEHLQPNAGIPWDKERVYEELSGPPNDWDEQTIDTNMFDAFAAKEMNATKFDRDSIMLYPIPARWTTNGFSVGLNSAISAMDKQFIAQNYP